MGILEITLKCCSFDLEISAFDPLHNCQGYSDPVCYFGSRKSFYSSLVGKPSTHTPNDTAAICFPLLGGQEKYDIIVNIHRCL